MHKRSFVSLEKLRVVMSWPRAGESISLKRWVGWEDTLVIKEAIKSMHGQPVSRRGQPHETLRLFVDVDSAVPSFLTQGNFCLSWTNFLPIFYGSENTLRFLRETKLLCFLVRVPRPQGLLLLLLLFVVELSLRPNLPIHGKLGPIFFFPDALPVVVFFQSISRCCYLIVFFPAHFILFWTSVPFPFMPPSRSSPTPARQAPKSCGSATKLSWFRCQLSVPQLGRGKQWLSAGGRFQNEVPADSQMLLKSGRTLFKVPVGRKNVCGGSET